MCGGKTKTSSKSTYTPTAEASGLYSNIIGQATNAAATPYNPATQQQVANFTPDQLAAFGAVGDAQGAWSPYVDRAGQLFEQSAGPISQEAIQGYMNPYQQMVIDAALAQSGRADAIQQNALKGNAIAGGALGGNSVGVAQGQLAGEQGRNRDSMLAQLLSGGYSQALNAAQSDAARQAGIGAQFGQLGQMVQGMSLNDIMAQLSVGNQQQAQQQTQLDANSANAAAQTMWPYQNAQWLASIGAGIGPLTGGTTTGSGTSKQGKGIGQVVGAGLSVASALSDRRAKEGSKIIGKTFDGQNVYSFRYKGSPKTQIGLMADEVQEHHPEAVGTGPYGLKTVDYGKATTFANGGAVNAFGGAGSKFFPWAQIAPSQPIMPELPQQSSGGGDGGGQGGFDPAQSIKLGKSARSGIEDMLRRFDPAGGWGASIEGGGSSSGMGLDKIASLFGKGFRDGGDVPGGSYSGGRFVDSMAQNDDSQIPVDIDRANALMRMLIDAPDMYGDNFTGSEEVMRQARMANGGGVNLVMLSPDVMTPYGLRPKRTPPLIDEFIGEIGPSGIDEPTLSPDGPGQLPVDALSRFPKQDAPAAESVPSKWSFENGQIRYNGNTAADFLSGRSELDPELRALDDAARQPIDAQAMPGTPYAAPSNLELDNGAIRYKGRTFADWLAGREDTRALEAQAGAPIDAQAMPFGGSAPAPVAAFGGNAPSPYSDVFPDMPGAMGDPSAAAGPEGSPSPGAFAGVPAQEPAAGPTADGQFDGLAFIRQQEGFKPNAYRDGRRTSIGYGTRGRPGETIDREEAERRLQREVGQVDSWISKNITTALTPQQRGALQSFGFNLGTGALDRLKEDINGGDWSRVGKRMLSFNKAENDEGKLVPVDGLTKRRQREAALLTGNAPAVDVAAVPEEVAPLVERGMDPTAPTGKYAGKDDRQTGGLLKRMFGIDFNPLKLSEDERQAMLVAGLSMMSTGDIGAGGLAGVKFLQGREAADRESAIAAAKLGLDFYKTNSEIDIARERLDLDRIGKPTDDARNYQLAKDEGFTGTFMDFMREKKLLDKGGAEIPAEVAARIGLGRVFLKDVPSINSEIGKFTAGDRADLLIGRGRAADVWRRIESGREALVRQLTGAGMSASEAENQTKRYQIQATDKNETMQRKVQMLERDLRAVEEGAIGGKTGAMARQWQSGASTIPAPSSGGGNRPRAVNRSTGAVIEFDGNAWVPATGGMEARP